MKRKNLMQVKMWECSQEKKSLESDSTSAQL